MMGKPRVAFFLPNMAGGGAERVCINLASGFLDHGLDVDFVLARASGPLMADLPFESNIVDLKVNRTLAAVFGLAHYLRQQSPVAVIAAPDVANLVAAWAKLIARSETLVLATNHNNIIHYSRNNPKIQEKIYPYLLRLFAPAFRGIVVVSKGNAEALERKVRFPRQKVQVIYNPIMHPGIEMMAGAALGHPWFNDDQVPVILAVGRLEPQKDYPTLLKAFAILQRIRQARLVILGDGSQRDKILALGTDLGISEHLDVLPYDPNPFRYMARSDVFVLSSAWEGFGNVLVEALACGTQVVATDCPSGPAEILENGKYGRLVPVGDVAGLAAAIDIAVDHSIPAELLKSKAKDFSIESAAKSYLRVLGLD